VQKGKKTDLENSKVERKPGGGGMQNEKGHNNPEKNVRPRREPKRGGKSVKKRGADRVAHKIVRGKDGMKKTS